MGEGEGKNHPENVGVSEPKAGVGCLEEGKQLALSQATERCRR